MYKYLHIVRIWIFKYMQIFIVVNKFTNRLQTSKDKRECDLKIIQMHNIYF